MVNVAFHLGSIGLTVTLFIISLALLLNDNPTWQRFFVLGVYLTTWSTFWGVIRGVVSQLMDAVRESRSVEEFLVGTLIVYIVAILISILLAWAVGGWILAVVSDPKWDVLSAKM